MVDYTVNYGNGYWDTTSSTNDYIMDIDGGFDRLGTGYSYLENVVEASVGSVEIYVDSYPYNRDAGTIPNYTDYIYDYDSSTNMFLGSGKNYAYISGNNNAIYADGGNSDNINLVGTGNTLWLGNSFGTPTTVNLYNTSGANGVYSLLANDTINDNGSGNNGIQLGAGNDTVSLGKGADIVAAGTGIDTIDWHAASFNNQTQSIYNFEAAHTDLAGHSVATELYLPAAEAFDVSFNPWFGGTLIAGTATGIPTGAAGYVYIPGVSPTTVMSQTHFTL